MKNESQNRKTYLILAKLNQKTAKNSGIMMNNKKHLDVTNGPPYVTPERYPSFSNKRSPMANPEKKLGF